jgi:hypothetical protein
VFIFRMKPLPRPRRLVGAAILLFFFFLPLHFHPVTESGQVAKECSCVHGKRTEAGLAPGLAESTPVLPAQPVAPESSDWLSTVQFQNRAIRAPPAQHRSSS